MTPEFVRAHSLNIGLLSDLVNGILIVNGFGELFSPPLDYVIIRVQADRVQGYNKDQVALVIPDPTDFGSWVPVILGTLTINRIINMIKESEIEELSVSLSGLGISHLLACHWAELSIASETASYKSNHGSDQLEWDCQDD